MSNPQHSGSVPRPGHAYHNPYHIRPTDSIPMNSTGSDGNHGNRLDDMFRHIVEDQKQKTGDPQEEDTIVEQPRRSDSRSLPLSYPDYNNYNYRLRPVQRAPRDTRLSAINEDTVHDKFKSTNGKSVSSSSSSGDLSPEPLKYPYDEVNEYYPKKRKFGRRITRELQLDPFGLPLEPQPLPDNNDPLTWNQGRKINVLILISIMSFLSLFLANSISSALWPLHNYFHVKFAKASYVIGAYLSTMGISPFIFNPLADRYGRRPLLVLSLVGTTITATVSGLSRTYAMIIAARAFNGFFAAIPIGLGSVIVSDLFFQHERGFYMGIYMVVQMTGGNLGPMLGGYIYKGINWHWCFYIPALVAGFLLFIISLTIPETLYSRHIEGLQVPNMTLYQQEYIRKKREERRKLSVEMFLRPFKMLRYPSIVLPTIYYSVASGYANIVFVISSGLLFHHYYKFHTWQTGLLLGLPLTFGSWLGEFGAGGFSDWVTERRALNRGGKRIPEDRLYAMLPGVFLAPLGLIIEGLCLMHRTHWVGPGIGIAIASAGFQIITTVTYAYTAECYPQQISETATLLNLGRQAFSFTLGFYTTYFIFRFGVQTAWLVYAAAELACFIPVLVLMWKGAQWRDNFPGPEWTLDL